MTGFEQILTASPVRKTPGGMAFKAVTDRGSDASIVVECVAPDIVRFRLFREEPARAFPLVHLPAAAIEVTIEDTGKEVQLTTDSLRCRVQQAPFQWSVEDLGGNVLWAQQRDDTNVRGGSNVPSLGFQQDAGSIKQVTDSFAIEPDDRFYGFGEKFFAHDKRGHTITSWNLDAYGVETERAYKNIPFFLCSKGYGVLVNSTARMRHAVGDPDCSRASYVLTVEDETLDYFFIAGPSFKHILRRYADLTGHAPVPPKWAFGLWMSRCYFHNRAVAEEVASKLRDLDIPCDVLVFDGYWVRDAHQCDLLWDEERFPNPAEMLAGLKQQGFKSCVWEGPFIPSGTEMWEEAHRLGFMLRNAAGEDYLINTGLVMASHNQEGFQGQETAGSFDGLPPAPPAGLVDFTNPAAVRWFQQKHEALMDLGVDVFKTDFGEQVPEDAVAPYSGICGAELHNLYSVLYNKAVFEVTRARNGQGVVWARSAYTGSQQYPVHWGGDPQTSFSSMAGSLRGGLSAALSGLVFWGHDIGGFFGSRPTRELYIRWAQFGLLSPLARCHGTTPREPWAYDAETVEIFRQYARLRYRLIPYLYSYAQEASQTGLPLMRPLALEFQEDPAAHHVDSQYLLGEWLMIAPVLSHRHCRTIYLPAGRWLDFWTQEIYHGPQHLRYEAPLNRLPLFLREGAIVPLGPELRYVGEKPDDAIQLLLFPGSESATTVRDEQEQIGVRCATRPWGYSVEVGPGDKDIWIQFVGIPSPVRVEVAGAEIPQRMGLADGEIGWGHDTTGSVRIHCPPAPLSVAVHVELS
ncbi:MAG: DUF4968 domain-containing protein [Anaerolineae bacterium]|nr:DUF4968 domain-containing protein [Anaerolineae bacterium]